MLPYRGFFAVAEKLIVGPILKTLVFSTTPEVTRQWIDSICADWPFTSIIPAVSRHTLFPGARIFEVPVLQSQHLRHRLTLPSSSCVQHFSAPIRAGPSELRAAFSFVYEPQLSAERAAAGSASTPKLVKAKGKQESANPAKVLDGFLVGLLGWLAGGALNGSRAVFVRSRSSGRKGFVYPEEDIAALNAAKQFLVKAGVVNK
jgi:hypothetical protein